MAPYKALTGRRKVVVGVLCFVVAAACFLLVAGLRAIGWLAPENDLLGCGVITYAVIIMGCVLLVIGLNQRGRELQRK